MTKDHGVIIVGAGAAGLAAAAELGRAGLPVTMLEARGRLGGRMFTKRDPVLQVPIELGAEFIHGLPPEIWRPLQARNIVPSEVDGDLWCFRNGQLCGCDFFSQVEDILDKMDPNAPDESFLTFLNRRFPDSNADPRCREARQHALGYVSGFNAADPDCVGVHWLTDSMKAEQKIEGQRAFRSKDGYADLLDSFLEELAKLGVTVKTGTIVESITWSTGKVEITAHDGTASSRFTCRRCLITLPLGVLKASAEETAAVRVYPALPAEKLQALTKLKMGKAARISLRFRHRFWNTISAPENSKTLAGMSFLFSQDDFFPTWWTTMPEQLPIITGWAPFRSAERLAGMSQSFVAEKALHTLGGLLNVPYIDLAQWLDETYFHDWQNDPFSRGAYSYGGVGSDGAQKALGSPLADTLFFAGEATDVTGHNGTVHGAIASGIRAAGELLASLP